MSCFGGRDELLYLLELTVERLRLTADKYREDFAERPPLVKLRFLDFPAFEVAPRRPLAPSVGDYDEVAGLVYACGKSVLFVRKPRDLVAAMKIRPLKVTMVGNDPEHRPKPYELTGGFNVLDSGQNFAGAISIYLRLTFFGSHIISHYQLYEDSCVFKNDFDGELRITKVEETTDKNEDNDEIRKQFKINEGTVLAAMRDKTAANGNDQQK